MYECWCGWQPGCLCWSKGQVWKAKDVVCLLQKAAKLCLSEGSVELLTTLVSIVVKDESPTKLSSSIKAHFKCLLVRHLRKEPRSHLPLLSCAVVYPSVFLPLLSAQAAVQSVLHWGSAYCNVMTPGAGMWLAATSPAQTCFDNEKRFSLPREENGCWYLVASL